MKTYSASAKTTVTRTPGAFADLQARITKNAEHFAYNFARRATKNMKAIAPVDTGYMKSQIKWKRNGKHDFTVYVDGSVNTERKAFYAIYVEYGTRNMAAQPFFRPGVEQAVLEFKREMKGVFSR